MISPIHGMRLNVTVKYMHCSVIVLQKHTQLGLDQSPGKNIGQANRRETVS